MGNHEKKSIPSGGPPMLLVLASLACCGALLLPALIGSAGLAALGGVFLNPVLWVPALVLFAIWVGIARRRKLLKSGSGMRISEPGKHNEPTFPVGRTSRTLE